MDDLIRRADLLEVFKKFPATNGAIPKNAVEALIEDAPTAYDLDKVLAELETIKGKEYIITEDAAGKHFVYWEKTCGFDTKTEYAIEIVKKGGKTAKKEKKLPPEVEQRMMKTFLGRN